MRWDVLVSQRCQIRKRLHSLTFGAAYRRILYRLSTMLAAHQGFIGGRVHPLTQVDGSQGIGDLGRAVSCRVRGLGPTDERRRERKTLGLWEWRDGGTDVSRH